MDFFGFELISVGVLFVLAVALGIWVHRLGRDDFEQDVPNSGMTIGMRRLLQIGIGLSISGSQLGGH